jgi:hypothetical protein
LTISFTAYASDEAFKTILAKTEKIRGLKFKEEVVFERLTPEKLSAFLNQELNRQYQTEDWTAIRDSFALLGAVPKDLALDRFYQELLVEQVGGLYDPHTRKMYVVGDLSLKVGMTELILIHELTHALTDQHFKLLSLPIEEIHNDDRALAAMCLVEGDATLAMIAGVSDLGMSSLFSTMIVSLFMNQDTFQTAPLILQSMMLFPYLGGETFLLDYARMNHSLSSHHTTEETKEKEGDKAPAQQNLIGNLVDWKTINSLYAHPPESTEQILHPEKFSEQRDSPTEIHLSQDDLKPLGEGWQAVWMNTCGEFLIKTWLLEHLSPIQAENAAEGWDGDRYLLAKNPHGELALYWRSVWDTEQDAQEFRTIVKEMAARKYLGGFLHLDPLPSKREVGVWILSNENLRLNSKGN